MKSGAEPIVEIYTLGIEIHLGWFYGIFLLFMLVASSNAVNITGGTISGLTTPLAVADGGTGLNALGTANYSLSTNGNADALTWMLNDRLDGTHFDIVANTDLNTLMTPGVYCCQSGTKTATLTNKPEGMGNSAFLMIVRYITDNYWEQEIIDNECNRWVRQYQISGTTWSTWQYSCNWFKVTKLSTDGSTVTNSFSLPAGTSTAIPFKEITPNSFASLTWAATGSKITINRAGKYMLFYKIALTPPGSGTHQNVVLFNTTTTLPSYLYTLQARTQYYGKLEYYTGFAQLSFSHGANFFFYIKSDVAMTMYGSGDVYSELYFIKVD